MRFRKLRIAWSVGCGVLCLLLIVMWLESYSLFGDNFDVSAFNQGAWIISRNGNIDVNPYTITPSYPRDYYNASFGGSHLLVVVITAALAAIPWIPWSKRFSLRTLLIATTLAAVVLGLIVWLSR